MASYLGQVETLKDEFNSLIPLSDSVTEQENQRDKFFMVLALIGLRADLSSVRDQILTSPVIPTLDETFARLLRISSTTTETESEPSVLAILKNSKQGDNRKWKGKGFKSHCTHCDKGGHTRDTCWALHGRPPRNTQNNRPMTHVAHSQGDGILPLPTAQSQGHNSVTLSGADYDEYLKYQALKQQSSSSMASVAPPGNSFACLTQSSHSESWIFDSGASDHISGNKNLFSTLHSPYVSSTITLANGSQTMIKGIGESKPLSSLPLVSILYAPECPFNLMSISKLSKQINCRVIFDPDSVLV